MTDHEEAIARRAMADTALRHSARAAMDAPPSDERVIARLRSLYTLRRDRWHAQEDAAAAPRWAGAQSREKRWDESAQTHARLQQEIIEAERRTLGLLRTDDRVSEDVLQRLQRELDLERMVIDSNAAGEGGLGESPYEVGDVDVE